MNEPRTGKVPLAAPDISSEDRARVSAALEGPWIAHGPAVDQFEEAVASRLGLGEGIALISGTAALHLALIVVGVERGDWVAMPSLTFVAAAHAASYLDALPLFFDSEPDYRQLDASRMIAWLRRECESDGETTIHVASGRRVGAIVSVDLLGHPCDVDLLCGTAREMGIPVVHDAAQSLGATWRGRPVGTEADVTCLSFNANKIVTSGGGGMLLARDGEMVAKARSLANQAKEPGPDYVHDDMGFNYRMPAAQAALGRSQFERLDDLLARKKRIARHYEGAVADVAGLEMPRSASAAVPTNWLFTVHVDPDVFGLTAHQLMKRLDERHRVESRPIFTPLHARGFYSGREAEPCLVAEALARSGLSLPSSFAISDDELDRVCEGIRAEAADR